MPNKNKDIEKIKEEQKINEQNINNSYNSYITTSNLLAVGAMASAMIAKQFFDLDYLNSGGILATSLASAVLARLYLKDCEKNEVNTSRQKAEQDIQILESLGTADIIYGSHNVIEQKQKSRAEFLTENGREAFVKKYMGENPNNSPGCTIS